MITVATVFAGTKYTQDYVKRLELAVSKHLTIPHRFVCLTDQPDELDCETLPIPLDLEAWWGKVALFGDLIPERILFFDLDTVIVGNIDDFARYEGDLAIIRPFYRNSGFASGVLNIGPGAHRNVWHLFRKSPERAIQFCAENADPPWNNGDQRWLELTVSNADYWQELLPGQLVSYKVHCSESGEKPDNARVICFHGKPDPHEVEDEWIVSNWRLPARVDPSDNGAHGARESDTQEPSPDSQVG